MSSIGLILLVGICVLLGFMAVGAVILAVCLLSKKRKQAKLSELEKMNLKDL